MNRPQKLESTESEKASAIEKKLKFDKKRDKDMEEVQVAENEISAVLGDNPVDSHETHKLEHSWTGE